MSATLITVAIAKAHLRRPDLDETDPDLLQKMDAAEDAVLNYVKRYETGRTESAAWTDPTTVPASVQHAILLLLARYDRGRGDEGPEDLNMLDEGSEFPREVTALLRRWSLPVLA